MPRKTDVNNPADWFIFIDSDLAGLKLWVEHEVSYVACRSKLAEVLEKLIKAELIRTGWTLIKTHDLRRLSRELASRDPVLERELRPYCLALAEAYMADRYVGFDLEDPDWPTLRAQLEAVTRLAATIRSRLPLPPP